MAITSELVGKLGGGGHITWQVQEFPRVTTDWYSDVQLPVSIPGGDVLYFVEFKVISGGAPDSLFYVDNAETENFYSGDLSREGVRPTRNETFRTTIGGRLADQEDRDLVIRYLPGYDAPTCTFDTKFYYAVLDDVGDI